MPQNWKIGDTAIAVKSHHHRWGFTITKGSSYTVTDLDFCPVTGELGFQIDHQENGGRVMWYASWFRKPFTAMQDLEALLTVKSPQTDEVCV